MNSNTETISNYHPDSLITNNDCELDKDKIDLLSKIIYGNSDISVLDFDIKKFKQECIQNKEFVNY